MYYFKTGYNVTIIFIRVTLLYKYTDRHSDNIYLKTLLNQTQWFIKHSFVLNTLEFNR